MLIELQLYYNVFVTCDIIKWVKYILVLEF